MRASIKEYILSFGYWGWVVVIGYIAGGVGAYLDIAKSTFPTWGWIALFVISSLIVPFIPYHKMRKNRELLRNKLEDIENSRPDIEYISFLQDPYRIPHTPLGEISPFMTSLVFANNPEYPIDTMTARNVRAFVTFYTSSTKPKEIFSVYSNWQLQSKNCVEIDIPPNGKPHRLNIALKYHDDQHCFGFGYDALETDYLYDMDTKKRLDIGNYMIEIIMQGTNIKKVFHFLLTNSGQKKHLNIQEITGFCSPQKHNI